MRKKRILTLSGILLGVLMCFNFNKVQAVDSVFSDTKLTRETLSTVAQANELNEIKYLGISKIRQSGKYYQLDTTTTNEGKKDWKITRRDSATSTTPIYDEIYYCVNATQGFIGNDNRVMAEGAIDAYPNQYVMNSTNKDKISSLSAGDLGTNYNKVLWILDNSYIPGKSTEEEKKALFTKVMQYIQNNDGYNK